MSRNAWIIVIVAGVVVVGIVLAGCCGGAYFAWRGYIETSEYDKAIREVRATPPPGASS